MTERELEGQALDCNYSIKVVHPLNFILEKLVNQIPVPLILSCTIFYMRTIFISLLLLLSLTSMAQTEHVKFLGIPLDGTIQQFEENLSANGCSFDQETSKWLPKGARAFKGSFAGHDARLLVFYDETTNWVYQAQAVISCHGEEACEEVFNDINSKFQEKYGALLSTKSIQYGHDSYGYTILSEQRVVMGDAGIFVTKNENTPDEFSVYVQYTDTANLREHERQASDNND